MTFVGRINQFLVSFIITPFLGQLALRYFRIYICHDCNIFQIRLIHYDTLIDNIQSRRTRCRITRYTMNIENDGDDDKQATDKRCNDCCDALPSFQPFGIVPTNRLDCTPETMRQVEPQCTEADNVNQCPQPSQCTFMEEMVDESSSVLRIDCAFSTCKFCEHHMIPELREVNDKEADDDKSENKHVLRRPFDLFWPCRYSIAIVTACFAVLQC